MREHEGAFQTACEEKFQGLHSDCYTALSKLYQDGLRPTSIIIRLFADGMLASPVTTRSFIYKDRDYYLPVVSVVGDDRFLYGDELYFQLYPRDRRREERKMRRKARREEKRALR